MYATRSNAQIPGGYESLYAPAAAVAEGVLAAAADAAPTKGF